MQHGTSTPPRGTTQTTDPRVGCDHTSRPLQNSLLGHWYYYTPEGDQRDLGLTGDDTLLTHDWFRTGRAVS